MSVTADTGERSRIIEAAYRCLVDSGGGGLSVTGVLNAAGLSTRAFYRHFDSKDALLLAMFRERSPVSAVTDISPCYRLRRRRDPVAELF